MIIDITGIELTPGSGGEDCRGNGKHYDERGKLIECCCDECDYLICCTYMENNNKCKNCKDTHCPRKI